jgi:hypothetical protein
MADSRRQISEGRQIIEKRIPFLDDRRDKF